MRIFRTILSFFAVSEIFSIASLFRRRSSQRLLPVLLPLSAYSKSVIIGNLRSIQVDGFRFFWANYVESWLEILKTFTCVFSAMIFPRDTVLDFGRPVLIRKPVMKGL